MLSLALTDSDLGTHAQAMDSFDRCDCITFEPGKRGGHPCVHGPRITVYDVLEYLARGMTVDELLEGFPYLTQQDVRACFAFAADLGRKITVIPA